MFPQLGLPEDPSKVDRLMKDHLAAWYGLNEPTDSQGAYNKIRCKAFDQRNDLFIR